MDDHSDNSEQWLNALGIGAALILMTTTARAQTAVPIMVDYSGNVSMIVGNPNGIAAESSQGCSSGICTASCGGTSCSPQATAPWVNIFGGNAGASSGLASGSVGGDGFTLNISGDVNVQGTGYVGTLENGSAGTNIGFNIYVQAPPSTSFIVTANVASTLLRSAGSEASATFNDQCSGGTLTILPPGLNRTFTCTLSPTATTKTTPQGTFYLLDSGNIQSEADVFAQPGTAMDAHYQGTISWSLKAIGSVMHYASGSGQTGVTGNSLAQPLSVQVVDGVTAAPVSGVPITFSIVAGGGAVLSHPNTSTDASGNASTMLTLGGAAGTYTVQAFCPSCAALQQITFTETARGPEIVLAKVPGEESGDGQEDVAGTLLQPFRVNIKIEGQPSPNRTVNWQVVQTPQGVPAGGLSASQTTTDSNGNSSVQFTLGPTPGPYEIQASCQDCTPGENQVSFVAKTSANRSSNRKRDTEMQDDFNIPGTCHAYILQTSNAPDGGFPATPPGTLMVCPGEFVSLECLGSPFDQATSSCDGWASSPAPLNLALTKTGPITADFFSNQTGSFMVTTNYSVKIGFEQTARQCQATRNISVGTIIPQGINFAPGQSRLYQYGIKAGTTLNVSVALGRYVNVDPLDSNKYIQMNFIQHFSATPPPMQNEPFVTEVTRSRSSVHSDGTFTLSVRFANLPFDQIPDSVEIDVNICGQSAPSSLGPYNILKVGLSP